MANPFEFLREWASEHVNATTFEDEATLKYLANECLLAARKAGINEAAVIKSAGGNLVSYMRAELESAANRELERLIEKDKQ
jgi:hypothetical protein